MTRFDDIASVYDAQIPAHVRFHLLERKTTMMTAFLGHLDKAGAVGLDLGCGTGWHVQVLREQGFRVVGIDNSVAQLREAQQRQLMNPTACWCLGEIQHLPFGDESADFAFAINVIHHLGTRGEQIDTVAEIHRVLKPDGLFFLHEVNTTNFVMATYMNHIFPKVRRIDNGLENWIVPGNLHEWRGFEVVGLAYFTFVPDFTPRALFPLMRWLEKWLERTPLRCCGAHYMAVLRKTG